MQLTRLWFDQIQVGIGRHVATPCYYWRIYSSYYYNFSWYGQMGMEEETARRIFRYCDQVRARRERKLGTISFLVTNEFYFSETEEKLLWKTSEEPHWRKMRRTTNLRTLHILVKWNRKWRETQLIYVLQL